MKGSKKKIAKTADAKVQQKRNPKSKDVEIIEDDHLSEASDKMTNYKEDHEDEENRQEIKQPTDEIVEGQYDDEVEDEDNLDDNAEIDDEDKDPDQTEEEGDDEGEEAEEVEEGEEAAVDEKCIYKYADEDDKDEEDDEDMEELFDDETEEASNIVPKEERTTKPFLFKYERVRLIGDRTKQISLGAKPMIKNSEHLPPKKVAELELEHRVMPLFIERPMPNGKRERWTLNELIY